MLRYLLIESRDSFENRDTLNVIRMADALARAGSEVTLFLVENGVLSARRGADDMALAALAASGVAVLADEFSLSERGMSANRLTAGVRAAPIDVLVDHLAAGTRTLWH
ncbi:MAG: sulfur reduction protein DsrE [Alphaproteobacteria bacterium]|nr:sulfur reduction protein DsrE [Alphaproteobacteria bacterium]